jgi:uncharacterized protein involved in cysteine biosynthesis
MIHPILLAFISMIVGSVALVITFATGRWFFRNFIDPPNMELVREFNSCVETITREHQRGKQLYRKFGTAEMRIAQKNWGAETLSTFK